MDRKAASPPRARPSLLAVVVYGIVLYAVRTLGKYQRQAEELRCTATKLLRFGDGVSQVSIVFCIQIIIILRDRVDPRAHHLNSNFCIRRTAGWAFGLSSLLSRIQLRRLIHAHCSG
jgi:hypothetical protein